MGGRKSLIQIYTKLQLEELDDGWQVGSWVVDGWGMSHLSNTLSIIRPGGVSVNIH